MLFLIPSKSGTCTEREGQDQRCPSQQITDPSGTQGTEPALQHPQALPTRTLHATKAQIFNAKPQYLPGLEELALCVLGFSTPNIDFSFPLMSVHILTKEYKTGKEGLIASKGLENSISWLEIKAAKELLRQGSLASVRVGKSV